MDNDPRAGIAVDKLWAFALLASALLACAPWIRAHGEATRPAKATDALSAAGARDRSCIDCRSRTGRVASDVHLRPVAGTPARNPEMFAVEPTIPPIAHELARSRTCCATAPVSR